MSKIAIFASGSGTNAENIIRFFRPKPEIDINLVLCNKPHAKVLERAQKHGIEQMVFTRDDFYATEKVISKLIDNQIDFIVLAGFLWLIPASLIAQFPDAIINVHPALLPKYGGKGMYGSKVHEAIINNKEKESGITIHYVNEKYDDGNIIYQAKCSIADTDTSDDLANKVHELEYKHYPRIIEEVVAGIISRENS